MASDTKAGRIVFIGNIPYNLPEEQVVDIASSVGQVLSFRLVYDSETGRPKGFGFAEFADTDAAASAVRNLDKYQINGRELRVDYSHVGGKEDNEQSQNTQQPLSNGLTQPPTSTGLPILPAGVELQPGLTCPDAISKTINLLPTPQLLDILSQMKGLVMSDPAKATELLKQAPQLSYAIFQAMLLMGLVDTSVLASVVEQAAQPAQQPAPPPSIPPSRAPQNYHPPPPQSYGQFGMPGHIPTPPVHSQPYQPPPMQPPPQQQPPPTPLDNAELLKQVLAMPQHEIDLLPPQQRAQIMALKQQLAAQGRF